MKEREFNFNTNEDEAIVTLTPSQKNGALKSLDDMLFLGSTMRDTIKGGKLGEGFKETCLKVMEMYTTDLLKQFDYDSILEKEKVERHSQIRSLNTENRALRQQLGEKASAEDVREALKIISEKLNTFWDMEGFRYIREMSFGQYGVKVEFSTGSLSGFWHGDDEGLAKHICKLKGFGFDLIQGRSKRSDEANALSFTPENIEVFNKLLSNHFGDYIICEIKSRSHNGKISIEGIEVVFRDFDELLNMPFPTYAEKEKSD